jgi:hypothetical protein
LPVISHLRASRRTPTAGRGNTVAKPWLGHCPCMFEVGVCDTRADEWFVSLRGGCAGWELPAELCLRSLLSPRYDEIFSDCSPLPAIGLVVTRFARCLTSRLSGSGRRHRLGSAEPWWQRGRCGQHCVWRICERGICRRGCARLERHGKRGGHCKRGRHCERGRERECWRHCERWWQPERRRVLRCQSSPVRLDVRRCERGQPQLRRVRQELRSGHRVQWRTMPVYGGQAQLQSKLRRRDERCEPLRRLRDRLLDRANLLEWQLSVPIRAFQLQRRVRRSELGCCQLWQLRQRLRERQRLLERNLRGQLWRWPNRVQPQLCHPHE